MMSYLGTYTLLRLHVQHEICSYPKLIFVILAETAGKLGAVLEGDGFIFYDVWIIAIS